VAHNFTKFPLGSIQISESKREKEDNIQIRKSLSFSSPPNFLELIRGLNSSLHFFDSLMNYQHLFNNLDFSFYRFIVVTLIDHEKALETSIQENFTS
jgi:hypothetical protein